MFYVLPAVMGCTEIALAIYSDSWVTMDTASEPGVRDTSFRAIPKSIEIDILEQKNWESFLCILSLNARRMRDETIATSL